MSTITANGASSSNTTSSFLTALVVNGALLGIEVGAFLVMKTTLYRIFSARTYLPPPAKRSLQLPKGLWKWLPAVIASPSEEIIHKNGLDAYMFLRYLRLLIKIFLVFTVMTFAVIVPVNYIHENGARSSFERITWTNLARPEDQPRFAAHVVMVYILTFFVIFSIRSEMSHFVHMRHQFLLSPSHSAHAQARTVLLTSVPDELANEHDMRQFASFVPGGVDKVWIYRDTKELNRLFEERQDACGKLEAAVASLLKDATAIWRKRAKMWEKKGKKARKAEKKKAQEDGGEKDTVVSVDVDLENQEDGNEMVVPPPSREFLDELVPANKRPTHRTGTLGMFGEKVDTIDWCKQEISDLNIKIQQARAHLVEGKPLGSVFILCNLQMGAHILAQCVSYHEPFKMIDKWIETHPKDIIWNNLDDNALEMRWRHLVSWLALIGLILAWFFPAAFIGTLSNIDSLCHDVHFLGWICRDLPHTVQNIIQGFLPPVLLAALFALLPLILKTLAWYGNIPRHSLISISVYRRFFIFLLIHGFLIVTITSGLTEAIEDIINNPTSTLQSLANRLPGASVFFLSYMVTQGMSGAGMALIQLMPLIKHYFKKVFLGRTPRQAFAVTFRMPSIDFGETLPRLSLLATIAFAYSVLNPLINFLAFVSYIMMYIAYKFLFLQVLDQPDQSETGGLYFPMGISNLFVGLYIEQICLACLFFLKTSNSTSRTAALAEGILMVFLVVITAIAQSTIRRSYKPITEFLPMSLATKQMAERYAHKKRDKHDGDDDDGEVMDLFSRHYITSVRRRITKFPKAIPKTIGGTLGTIGTITAKAGAKVGLAVGISGFSDEGHEQHELQPRGSSSPPSSALIPTTTTAAGPSGLLRPSTEMGHDDDHISDHHDETHDEHRELINDNATACPPLTSRPSDRGSTSSFTMQSFRPSIPLRLSRPPSFNNVSDHSHYEELKSPDQDQGQSLPPPRPFLHHLGTSNTSRSRREKGESVVVPPPPREEDEEDLDDHAFDHPSTYVEQRWIWVPKDRLGLSKVIIQELKDAGVEASDDGATMDKKGVVEVTRNPPDEVWEDGHNV
ncbi:hypothetical protein D9758_005530 [Tetrapyrgos nigripes]|uniref:DUF221-domain-containing protein n=1 Tax=Tetrapyrgos nigripes TaxID=182062 RepID=A0A8H5LPH5_9AGAR|nr:hypothetical protein D9758_005530 [Tetrapyrgos nigripes]